MALIDDILNAPTSVPSLAAPEPNYPASPDMGGISPVVQNAPQSNKPGRFKAMLSNALQSIYDANQAQMGNPDFQRQQMAIDAPYQQMLIDKGRDEIAQNQPVTIPDNVATIVGLEKGSQVPKSSYGQVMSAYMRMLGQQGKPSAAGDKEKYMGILTRENLGVPISPEDQAWRKSYETTATLNSVKGAEARGEAYGKIRVKTLYDTKTHSLLSMNANEWNKANADEPGRYIEPSMDISFQSRLVGAKAQAGAYWQARYGVVKTVDDDGNPYYISRLGAQGAAAPEGALQIFKGKQGLENYKDALNRIQENLDVMNDPTQKAIIARTMRSIGTVHDPGIIAATIGNAVSEGLDPKAADLTAAMLQAREFIGANRQFAGNFTGSEALYQRMVSNVPGPMNAVELNKALIKQDLDNTERIEGGMRKFQGGKRSGNTGGSNNSKMGKIIVSGPKGRFEIPADKLPLYKKNGYSPVGGK